MAQQPDPVISGQQVHAHLRAYSVAPEIADLRRAVDEQLPDESSQVTWHVHGLLDIAGFQR